MRSPRALQSKLALAIGGLVTLLWLAAAGLTVNILRGEMNEVLDSALQETAERLLPLAVSDILGREKVGVTQRVSANRATDEHFTYVVRDQTGLILLQSHTANPAAFPDYGGIGFSQTETLRIYSDEALQGSLTISVAEPLQHRSEIARELAMGLGLPLLLVIPLSLAGIVLVVRSSLKPVRQFRAHLARRGARDLSAMDCDDLPTEILPLGRTLNDLFARLNSAFEAERSFAANAAHELRTPLAGAIAQAQRLQVETSDPLAAARAADIEATLKRLTRLSERLMQLARVEGGRLRLDSAHDLAAVLRLTVTDAKRNGPIQLDLPDRAVLSDLDPDIFAILCRNLIENAQRHGTASGTVVVSLAADAVLKVQNDCDPIAPEVLARLDTRFARAPSAGIGSGIGLAIVSTIAARAGGQLTLTSPIPGKDRGFEARVRF